MTLPARSWTSTVRMCDSAFMGRPRCQGAGWLGELAMFTAGIDYRTRRPMGREVDARYSSPPVDIPLHAERPKMTNPASTDSPIEAFLGAVRWHDYVGAMFGFAGLRRGGKLRNLACRLVLRARSPAHDWTFGD